MSKIEWTEETWNPVTGCTKVSAGCKYCYAETMSYRLKAMGTPGYENGFELSLMPERLIQPLNRKKPTTYFVNSMSDLFHENIPFAYIDKVLDIIQRTPHHKYQILTKRASRLVEYFGKSKLPENIWLGVTVENKLEGLQRIEYLRKIKASIRFLSVEPLLEDLGQIDLSNIHWVIVGGESGSRARQMQPKWATNIKEQCKQHNVSFFFKQWGTWGADAKKRTKHANGRILDGETHDAMPILLNSV